MLSSFSTKFTENTAVEQITLQHIRFMPIYVTLYTTLSVLDRSGYTRNILYRWQDLQKLYQRMCEISF